MSNDVKITISGNDAQMIAVWQRQQAEILNNQQALMKMGQAGERAGAQISKGIEAGLLQATRFVSAISGIGSVTAGIMAAASALKREYEDLMARQKKAANAQINLADAQSQLLINLGTDKEVDAQKAIQMAREGSRATGLSEKDFTQAFSDALSARGDKSATEAFQATKAAGALLPFNPEAAKLLSGATLDISKGANISPEAAVGYFASVSRAARVTNFQGTAEHIAPGIVGVTKFGDDLQKAGALLATLSLGEADPTGRRSRTASISLAQQLEERLPDLPDTEARIRAIQGDDKLRKRFFEGGKFKVGGKNKEFGAASFEATALPTVRGLLSGDAASQERKEYEASLQNVIDPAKGEQVYAELMKDIGSLPSVQLARKKRFSENAAEGRRIDDKEAGRIDVSREGLEDILSSHGYGSFARKDVGSAFAFDVFRGLSPEYAMEKQLRSAAAMPDVSQSNQESLRSIADQLSELVRLQSENNRIADKKAQVPLAGPGVANDRRGQ